MCEGTLRQFCNTKHEMNGGEARIRALKTEEWQRYKYVKPDLNFVIIESGFVNRMTVWSFCVCGMFMCAQTHMHVHVFVCVEAKGRYLLS